MGRGLTLGARRSRAMLAVVLIVVFGLTVPGRGSADEVTMSTDAARTGWDSHEPGLTPASVGASDFGQLFQTKVDGQVYGQPAVVNGVLVVTTENNKAYGLDPVDGAIKWTRDLGPAWPASAINCGDLTPTIGGTSASVYDPGSGTLYFTTKVNDGPDVQHPHYYMHAIDPSNKGEERSGWPVTIAGSPSNDPGTPFDPMVEMQRPGLLLMDGIVYAGFGSHCDHNNYRGYVVGVDTANHAVRSMWATEVGASNQGSGVWQGGGGLVSDGPGRIFFSTGNGVTPPVGPGTKPPGTLSESVIRLQVNADKSLSTADFFSPSNAGYLDINDTDLGSGGPVALPDSFGTPTHPHVLYEEGKDGRIFLLDRDKLGGRSQTSDGGDDVLGVMGPYEGLWGHPATWSGEGGYVYSAGNGGPLRAFRSGVSGGGVPALSLAGTSADTFPYTSGSPVVTSDGTSSGSGVVWIVWANGSTGGNAQLRAYGAVPEGNQLPLLWSAPIGTAVKFTVPATDSGRVYVGTRDGYVYGFGRPATSALTGQPVDFGSVGVGTSSSKPLTLVANQALSVTGVSTTTPFTVTAPQTLPVAMNKGDSLQIPVTFTPGAPGATSQIVKVTTDHGTFNFSVNGTATQPGLMASPVAVAFPTQAVGVPSTVNVRITNTGTSDETISAVTGPSAPFTATGLPSVGTVISAGVSQVFTVTYQPTSAASDSSSVAITSTSGTLTVPISGKAETGSGKLVINPLKGLDFGRVPMGTARDLTFDLTNAGNLPLTVSLAKAPASDFTTRTPLSEGVVIGPGQVVHQQVTFRPTKPGTQTDTYKLNGGDGQGVINVPLTGVGAGKIPWPSPGDWSANGSATEDLRTKSVQLTPSARYKSGTYLYGRPVPTDAMTSTFATQMSGGNGADGISFMLLDPAKATPRSVGGAGGGLGFQNLKGVALMMEGNSKASTVGLAVSPGSGAPQYVAKVNAPKSLRGGTHYWIVQINGGRITVTLDRRQILNTAMPGGSIPANALVGWGGATGYLTDTHTIIKPYVALGSTKGAPLAAAPQSVDFRSTQVGSSVTQSLTLTNSGGLPEQVTSVSAPQQPFSATLPSVGTIIPVGGTVQVPVTFKPDADGTIARSMTVTTSSGSTVVPINGIGENTLPDLTTSSWSYSGYASLSGSTVTLTSDGQYNGGGLLVNGIAVPSKGVHATFTAQIGGSHTSGADGLTFALLDASAGKPTAPGAKGGGLGLAGIPGVFVALDTYRNGSVRSNNFVAIGTSSSSTTLSFTKVVTSGIPALRKGSHTVDVTVTPASHLVVSLDGKQIADVAVTLPPKVLAAFTAGVGGISDTHAILNPVIEYTG